MNSKRFKRYAFTEGYRKIVIIALRTPERIVSAVKNVRHKYSFGVAALFDNRAWLPLIINLRHFDIRHLSEVLPVIICRLWLRHINIGRGHLDAVAVNHNIYNVLCLVLSEGKCKSLRFFTYGNRYVVPSAVTADNRASVFIGCRGLVCLPLVIYKFIPLIVCGVSVLVLVPED